MKKFLFALLAVLPLVARAWEYPASTQELPYEGGMGTEENPFIIKNAQQLVNLSYHVNNGENYAGMYFQLGNDIDLNPGYTFNPNDENSYQDAKIWTPIGATSCFKGNFDGNGHTISGLLLVGKNIMRYNDITTIYEGLFGEIEDMTLSDMTIDNSIILYNVDASEIDNITCGFFAADAKNCNLNELVNKGTILLTTTNMNTYVYYQISGIVANVNQYFTHKELNNHISGCSNYGTMTVVSDQKPFSDMMMPSGCLTGIVCDSSDAILYDCHNYGNLDGGGALECGGIGFTVTVYDNETVFEKLSNSGDIIGGSGLFNRACAGKLKDSYNEGNIINGCGLMNDCQFVRLENCYNTGNVNDPLGRGVNGTGGLIGYSDYLNEMTNCYNSGNITSNYSCGGLIGCAGPYNVSLTNCFNKGDIISNPSLGTNNAGGLVGTSMGSGLSFIECSNEGNIKGEMAGGLSGYANWGATVTGCMNSGNINGSYNVGGILGYGSDISITNAYNTGNVNGNADNLGWSYVGGIIGRSNGAPNTIEDCHNTGEVTADGKYVGGIGGSTYITNRCFNSGKITGGIYVAGINGSCGSNNNVSISNCYNVGDITGDDMVAGLSANLNGTAEYSFNYGNINCETDNKALLWIFGYLMFDNLNSKSCVTLEQNDCDNERLDIGAENTVQASSEGASSCSSPEFASGRICILLNADQAPTPWGQTVGTDPYPLLNGQGNPENVDTGIRKISKEMTSDSWTVSTLNGETIRTMETSDINSLLSGVEKGIYIISSRKNGSFKILWK